MSEEIRSRGEYSVNPARSTRPARRGIGISGAVTGVATLLLLTVAVMELRPGQTEDATVTRVYDGDTIEALGSGRSEKIRSIGIDTPEMDDPRPAVLEMAQEAAQANRELVGGRTVRLELDVQERDRYGRLLAYVWLGDTLVNEWMVREGYAAARSFPPNLRHQDRLNAAQREATGADRRLWDGRLADGSLRMPAPGSVQGKREGANARPGDGERITAFEAAAHEGQIVTVCDSVASTKFHGVGRRTFLNLVRPYPDQPFTVVIPYEVRLMFGDEPETRYQYENVCVAGVITLFEGKPEIIIHDPDQIAPR
jgi:micrococcal nuclease